MAYYQIIEREPAQHHAGSKAVNDVSAILSTMGFKELTLIKISQQNSKVDTFKRQINYFKDWRKIARTIQNGDTIVLQHPFHNRQLTRFRTLNTLKQKKHVKFISIVHDVEELRNMFFSDYYAKEFNDMLYLADAIIVHNHIMKEFFVSKGYPENQIEILGIFDYLHHCDISTKKEFEKSVTVAGNLDNAKSPYIQQLAQIDGLDLHLFGPNLSESMTSNDTVKYHGSLPPEEVPQHLKCGFGLVWDGSSLTSCEGNSGQYLRYNSPHKLSLYLSSGLPVLVWDKAASADFVNKHQVGAVVSSLTDIPKLLDNLTEEMYYKYVQNANTVSEQLRNGYFTRNAIERVVKKLEGR